MPVIHDVPLILKTQQVLHREGLPGYSQIRPEIRTLVWEVLADLKKSHLMEPSVAYHIYTVTELRRQQLSLEGKPVVHDSLLSSVLPHARELAVAVRTIDLNLEEQMPLLVKAIQVNGGLEFKPIFKEECQKRNIRLFVLSPNSPK
jgi:hypothetical protein